MNYGSNKSIVESPLPNPSDLFTGKTFYLYQNVDIKYRYVPFTNIPHIQKWKITVWFSNTKHMNQQKHGAFRHDILRL